MHILLLVRGWEPAPLWPLHPVITLQSQKEPAGDITVLQSKLEILTWMWVVKEEAALARSGSAGQSHSGSWRSWFSVEKAFETEAPAETRTASSHRPSLCWTPQINRTVSITLSHQTSAHFLFLYSTCTVCNTCEVIIFVNMYPAHCK